MADKMIEYAKNQEEICRKNDTIALRLYDEYGVNRGLRDENGNGVEIQGSSNTIKILSNRGYPIISN